jgi:hypothetical protein
MTYKYWLILACSGIFHNVLAADKLALDESILKQKINQAIVKFENTQRENWAYQIDRYENEEGDITSSVERFTPHLDMNLQWTLITKNGETPTKKQQNNFAKDMSAQVSKQEKGANHAMKLRELINQESLVFKADNGSHISMDFNVHVKKLGEDSKGKLTGVLFYNKEQEFIDEIAISNNAEFSPMFSASISEFLITFNFIKIDNAILPKQNKLQMKGTFAYFTQIDEVSNDIYSNYEQKITVAQ